MNPVARARRTAAAVGLAGVVLVTAYAGWAAVQILVLNPLAVVPGRSLAQIRADVAAAGESMQLPFVFGILATGVLLAVAAAVVTARSRHPSPWLAAMLVLTLLVLGAPAYFAASFGPGMALADTYLVGGGDGSPWGRPLYLVSLVALAGVVGLAVVGVRRGWAGGTASSMVDPARM